MPDRSRAGRSALLGPFLVALAACTTAPAPAPTRAVAVDLLPFLPDPAPFGLGDLGAEATDIYRGLLSGQEPGALATRARQMADRAGAAAGPRVLLAETLLVAGHAELAQRELAALPPALLDEMPIRLLEARAAEAADDWITAAEGYRAAASGSSAAATRLAGIDEPATAALLERIDALVAAARIAEATAAADQLERWHPLDERAFEASRRVARAANDSARELRAVRALSSAHPDRQDLMRRRGVLEVEIGDAAAGIGLLQALAARAPDDAGLAADLRRGKFLFRLANAPEEVRHAALLPQLTRADFARLLYWLVPEVRTSRGGAARIATDILDSPAREEIVRVANLGLLDVDETLHRFEPDRALSRGEAFRSLGLVAARGSGVACGGGAQNGPATPCAIAVRCGWIPEAGECLAQAPVSGPQATEWIRAATGPQEGGS